MITIHVGILVLDSDSFPEDSTFPRTLGKVQLMRREHYNNRLVTTDLSPYSWEIRDLEVSTVDSPDIEGAITCLTDIKTEPGLRRRSKKPMHVNVPILVSY